MRRVFIGIPLDDATRTALSPLLDALRTARVPDPSDLHVTLQFLGAVDETRIPPIVAALAPLSEMHGGDVGIRTLGTFPDRGRARIVHARIDDHDGLVASLAARVAELVAPLGFAREARPFSPHVTLARVDPPAEVELPATPLDLTVPVHAVSLFESRHGAPPRYHALHTFPLATSTSVRAGPGRQETHDHRPPA